MARTRFRSQRWTPSRPFWASYRNRATVSLRSRITPPEFRSWTIRGVSPAVACADRDSDSARGCLAGIGGNMRPLIGWQKPCVAERARPFVAKGAVTASITGSRHWARRLSHNRNLPQTGAHQAAWRCDRGMGWVCALKRLPRRSSRPEGGRLGPRRRQPTGRASR